MHTRRRGSSDSDKPAADEPPEWSDVDEDAIVSALATAKQRLDSLQSGTAADRLQTVNQQLEKALGGSEGASVAKMTGMQTRMMRDLLMQQRQLNKLLATHVRLEASKDLQAHSIALRQ